MWLLLLLIPAALSAQNQEHPQTLSLQQALQMAVENNYELKNARINVEIADKLRKTAFDLPGPEATYEWGQINSALSDRHLSISQSVAFPTVYTTRGKLQKRNLLMRQSEFVMTEASILRQIKTLYIQWMSAYAKYQLARQEDSIYRDFTRAVQLRYQTGEVPLLTQSVAETQALTIENKMYTNLMAQNEHEQTLKSLLGISGSYVPGQQMLKLPAPVLPAELTEISTPSLAYLQTKSNLMDAALSVERNKYFPAFNVGYFNQTLDEATGFDGWQVGVSVPLWFWPQQAQVQVAKLQRQQVTAELDFQRTRLNSELRRLANQLMLAQQMVDKFEAQALEKADQILIDSQISLMAGEVTYFEFMMSISHAYQIKYDYLEMLANYNLTIIQLEEIINANNN